MKGIKRWQLVMQDLYLNNVIQSAEWMLRPQHPSGLSILTSLVAFRGEPLRIRIRNRKLSLESIDEYFDYTKPDIETFNQVGYNPNKLMLIEKLLQQQEGLFANTEDIHYLLRDVREYKRVAIAKDFRTFGLYQRIMKTKFNDLKILLLYLLSPEPLDIMYKQALQFPLTYEPPKI